MLFLSSEQNMRVYGNTISKLGLLVALLCLPAWGHSADVGQYLGWGNQMLGQRNYSGAARYYQAVIKADPRNEAAYRGLGYCYLGLRDQSHGAQYLEYALRLNPADSSLRMYLGRLYQDYGNTYYSNRDRNRALYWWNRSLAVNPSNPQLYAYVSAQERPATQASAAAAPAPSSQTESLAPAPGINPWIMGGTVAVLGAIMIFLF
ncbi:MAG: tetratricopeptide repeat protein [bacterium]